MRGTRVTMQMILEPLDAGESIEEPLDEVHPNIATGYLTPAMPGAPWRTNIYSVHPIGGGDGSAVVSAPEDIERFLRAVSRGGAWTGVTPSTMLTPHPAGEDGAFGKDGADPGVATVCRYIPAIDTTAVLLAKVGWDDIDGMSELWTPLTSTAFDE